MENNVLSVSDFIALTNQTLEYAYPTVHLIGEVQSFKINQNKYVFFDLKDQSASVGCFMMVFQLRTALEDGMKVEIVASPKLTNWGKFSLTVREVIPVGEGSIKRSFELLVKQLQTEGLFDEVRKRPLPEYPHKVGIISSKDAAGYADFVKILNERWGGLSYELAHVQVQGQGAADQVIRAVSYFNEQAELPDVLVIIRGGGSADDLATFNDEHLVRSVAASRIPVLTGIGHEIDTTLIDLVADRRAATPSNAAQLLVPDKKQILQNIHHGLSGSERIIQEVIIQHTTELGVQRQQLTDKLDRKVTGVNETFRLLARTLEELNPEKVLTRGYAILRQNTTIIDGKNIKTGDNITITTSHAIIQAGVTNVSKR